MTPTWLQSEGLKSRCSGTTANMAPSGTRSLPGSNGFEPKCLRGASPTQLILGEVWVLIFHLQSILFGASARTSKPSWMFKTMSSGKMFFFGFNHLPPIFCAKKLLQVDLLWPVLGMAVAKQLSSQKFSAPSDTATAPPNKTPEARTRGSSAVCRRDFFEAF